MLFIAFIYDSNESSRLIRRTRTNRWAESSRMGTCVIINLISENPWFILSLLCWLCLPLQMQLNKISKSETRKNVIRIFNDWKCDVNWKARHATATSSAILPIPFNRSTKTWNYQKKGKVREAVSSFRRLLLESEQASRKIQVTSSYSLMIPSCAIRNRFRFHREKLNWKIPTGRTWDSVSQAFSTAATTTTLFANKEENPFQTPTRRMKIWFFCCCSLHLSRYSL